MPIKAKFAEFFGKSITRHSERVWRPSLLRRIAHSRCHGANLKPTLIPIPFAAWYALAWFAGMLSSTPVTRNQLELTQIDNVASRGMPGVGELAISPLLVRGDASDIFMNDPRTYWG